MSSAAKKLGKLKTGVVVVTPVALRNITPNKKYIVQSISEGYILLINDKGDAASYSAYQFIEADLYFTMCLFYSLLTIFNIRSKIYE